MANLALKLKCIIVDDELKSRESLRILIEDFCDDVDVRALCQNVNEGLDAIAQHKPDVVFLDIQMQRETGFDLLNKVSPIDFDVIFTTAHAEYAIRAFKFSAVDYLLKPIDIEELRTALVKVRQKHHGRFEERLNQLMQNLNAPAPLDLKLSLPTSDGLIFIKVSDILFLEASSNYTLFHTRSGGKYIVSKTLRFYEDMLTDFGFFRIHHSYVINIKTVSKYVRGEGGYVILENGAHLDVSKRRKEAFLSRISSLN